MKAVQKTWKYCQRRALTYFNSWAGFSFVLLLVSGVLLVALSSALYRDVCQLRGSAETNQRWHCSLVDFTDNIGGVHLETDIAYAPIDVVYTWVNGSDPVWRKKKELWQSKKKSRASTENTTSTSDYVSNATLSTVAVVSSNSSSDPNGTTLSDTLNDSNRFRDSDELKYSLRSLETNAPWIRHIYLVTDNQIPSWLNLESGRLTIVPHTVIFENASHLPVFSSPAIESHLHQIPGLSKKFIYFNDDVFLGSKVLPEDFVTVSGVQKFYMSWDVPKCAPGCSDSWIGDGYCDSACNVSACNFDFPDCVNGSNVHRHGGGGGGHNDKITRYCAPGCPESWLADKVCDMRCNVEECGWDSGDCGIELVTSGFPGVDLRFVPSSTVGYISNQTELAPPQLSDYKLNEFDEGQSFLSSENETETGDKIVKTEIRAEPPGIAMSLPIGAKALYVNVSSIECFSSRNKSYVCPSTVPGFVYTSAEYTESPLVHTCTMVTRHQVVVCVLYDGQENAPAVPRLPHDVLLRVSGSNSLTDVVVVSTFRIRFLPRTVMLSSQLGCPANMGSISGHINRCGMAVQEDASSNTTSLRLPIDHFRLLSRPFNYKEGRLRGFAIELRTTLPEAADARKEYLLQLNTIYVSVAIQFANNSVSTTEYPLQSVIGSIASKENLLLKPLFHSTANETNYNTGPALSFGAFLESRVNELSFKSLENEEDSLYVFKRSQGLLDLNTPTYAYWQLLVPLPMKWKQFHAQKWVHYKINFLSKIAEDVQMLGCLAGAVRWGGETSVGSIEGRSNSTIDNDDEANTSVSSLSTSHSESMNTPTEAGDGERQSRRRLSGEFHGVSENIRFTIAPRPTVRSPAVGQIIRGATESSADNGTLLSLARSWVNKLLAATNPIFLWLSQEPRERMRKPFFRKRRRLQQEEEDSYAASLIHVNRLYNKKFGMENRKVPAHMPHMIDRDVMAEMQTTWQNEWNETSTHRFRSKTDMQYSFSYYYYVMNRHKVKTPDFHQYIANEVDANRDGYLDENEFRSLVAVVDGNGASEERIAAVWNCTVVAMRNLSTNDSNATQFHETTSNLPLGPLKSITRSVSLERRPSIEDVLLCPLVQTGMANKIDWSLVQPAHTSGAEKSIAFEMIGDNFTNTLQQLDSVRARRSKFVCINDNMKHPTPELLEALKLFYLSFFPFPSQFELPSGSSNPTLYYDEYIALRRRKFLNRGKIGETVAVFGMVGRLALSTISFVATSILDWIFFVFNALRFTLVEIVWRILYLLDNETAQLRPTVAWKSLKDATRSPPPGFAKYDGYTGSSNLVRQQTLSDVLATNLVIPVLVSWVAALLILLFLRKCRKWRSSTDGQTVDEDTAERLHSLGMTPFVSSSSIVVDESEAYTDDVGDAGRPRRNSFSDEAEATGGVSTERPPSPPLRGALRKPNSPTAHSAASRVSWDTSVQGGDVGAAGGSFRFMERGPLRRWMVNVYNNNISPYVEMDGRAQSQASRKHK